MGWGLIQSHILHSVAGQPDAGQVGYYLVGKIGFYLVFPLLMLSVSLVPGALLGQTDRGYGVAVGWCSLTLFAALPYFLFYGGGV